MSAEDIEYTGDYKEFPTKESALDWLDNYLSLDERNNLIRALQQDSTTKNNRGVDCSLDDFIKYCKRTFGVELTVKKSDNPDTCAKLFGTTKNDLEVDCVRRKAVLNTLERMDKVLYEDRTVDLYKELLKECYKVLPSVTPQEPRKGHWCPQNVDMVARGEMQYSSEYDARTNFCPNCGADMREGKE